MEDIISYIIYEEDLQVLICRSCRYALNPNGVKRHFQRYHKGVSLRLRKKIVEWCGTLHSKRPEEVAIPVEGANAIEGLKVIDGFMCQTCNSLCGTLSSMVKHCQDSHDWTTCKSKYTHGWKESADLLEDMWTEKKLQTLSINTGLKYFRVRGGNDPVHYTP
jgi:hypothetical protein